MSEKNYTSELSSDQKVSFKELLNNTPGLIWMSDTDNRCVFVNAGWTDFTGRTVEQELGGGWMEGVHESDIGNCRKEFLSASKERKKISIEYRLLNHEREYRWILVNGKPRFSSDGIFLGYIGSCTDIHESKRVNEELEKRVSERTLELKKINNELTKQNEFIEAIVEASIDIISVYDTDMRLLALNKRGEEVIGQKKSSVIGKTLLETLPNSKDTQGYKDLVNAIAGETIHNKLYRSSITGKFYENYLIPLKNDKSEVYAVLIIAHDNTDIIQSKEKLEEAYKILEDKNVELERSNNELASFSYIASHDLQEPLRKIQAFGKRLIEKEKNLSDAGQDYFNRMIGAANRMQDLIEALLKFSRTATSAKNFEPSDLNILIEEVKKELREAIEEKHAVIEIAPLPNLTVIPFQFKQMISNIIGNSLKYSKKEVPLIIKIHSDIIKADDSKQNTSHALHYCKITIIDNGIGFDQIHSEKIFELFQRLHGRAEYSGSGIGLAICKKIAENHGGYITAESEVGAGSSFNIFIPVRH